VTVRRTRSRSFIGQFETQLVLRPCPSDETLQTAFKSRSAGAASFNNLTAEALLVAAQWGGDDHGVPNPFPPGSAPQGPKNGVYGLIERVGGLPPPPLNASSTLSRRRLASKEEALSRRGRGRQSSSSTSSSRAFAAAAAAAAAAGGAEFDKDFYDMKERHAQPQAQTQTGQGQGQGRGQGKGKEGGKERKETLADFVFSLERTRSYGTPYAPGITKGNIPSWYHNN